MDNQADELADQLPDWIAHYADRLEKQEASYAQLRQELALSGMDEPTIKTTLRLADELVLERVLLKQAKRQNNWLMAKGVWLLAWGLMVTLGSIWSALNGGPVIVIAYGALLAAGPILLRTIWRQKQLAKHGLEGNRFRKKNDQLRSKLNHF
jgi:hypothetical protein